jgi:hypothetical protein
MALFRLGFFYEQGENGWSESIHTSLTDPAQLENLVFQYAQKRLAFTHPSTKLVHVRISDDEVFRDIILDPIVLPMIGQYKPPVPAESPFTAFDARMSAGNLVTRSMFVRGLPDGQIDGVTIQGDPGFLTAYDAWGAFIVNNAFSIKNKDRTQVKQPINTVSLAGVVNMVTPIPGLALLSQVQILGVPRSLVPKRTYIVSAITDGANFTIRNYTGPALAGIGFFRRINYLLLKIDVITTDAVTERRIGRPFGQLRGRRAVVR